MVIRNIVLDHDCGSVILIAPVTDEPNAVVDAPPGLAILSALFVPLVSVKPWLVFTQVALAVPPDKFVAVVAVAALPVMLIPQVPLGVPPKVRLPLVVTVPVKVSPLTVPVPLTLVTVPVLLVLLLKVFQSVLVK